MATEAVPPNNKTWELSLYELHRTPQEAITDNTEIAVSPRSLHSELMCPICLDMLKNTMTTKECLHRFCQECIITALRSGNKECPTCRKKLVSKRSLRPDPNFDALISKIYPSRDEYEAHQERVLARLNKHHNASALTHSIEEGLRIQAMNRAQRVRKHGLPTDDGKRVGEGSTTSAESTPRKRLRTQSDDSGQEGHETEVQGDAEPEVENEQEDDAGTSSPHETEIDQGDLDGDSNSATEGTSEIQEPTERVNEIELVFKPHPKDNVPDAAAQTRYIKTTANASGTYHEINHNHVSCY